MSSNDIGNPKLTVIAKSDSMIWNAVAVDRGCRSPGDHRSRSLVRLGAACPRQSPGDGGAGQSSDPSWTVRRSSASTGSRCAFTAIRWSCRPTGGGSSSDRSRDRGRESRRAFSTIHPYSAAPRCNASGWDHWLLARAIVGALAAGIKTTPTTTAAGKRRCGCRPGVLGSDVHAIEAWKSRERERSLVLA